MSSFFDPLWVVASYYNPAGYKRRLQNFRAFRRRLNAPLMVVELAQSGGHQLSQDDADIVLSLTGEDRIWQKERLLNIGIAELPRHVEYVAWVDCDVVFDDEGWVDKARARLDENGGLLQLFSVAVHLPREVDAASISRQVCRNTPPLFTNIAIANAIRGSVFDENETRLTRAQGASNNDAYISIVDKYNSYGIAWSASRKTIEKCGLYDRNIVGGGDTVHVFAALSRLEQYFVLRPHNDKQKRQAESWAQEAKNAGLLSNIDSLEQNIFHMWHGDIIDRHYRKRYEILTHHGFDPATDIELADNGTWRWRDPDGALAREVGAYFWSRREDGDG